MHGDTDIAAQSWKIRPLSILIFKKLTDFLVAGEVVIMLDLWI